MCPLGGGMREKQRDPEINNLERRENVEYRRLPSTTRDSHDMRRVERAGRARFV
jgi:hypothetical protein